MFRQLKCLVTVRVDADDLLFLSPLTTIHKNSMFWVSVRRPVPSANNIKCGADMSLHLKFINLKVALDVVIKC